MISEEDSSTPGKPWDYCGTGKQFDYNLMSNPNPKSPAELLSDSWPLETIRDNECLLVYAGSLGKICKPAIDN